MKVHLIKTPEYSNDSFIEVANFLTAFDGPIEFITDYFKFSPNNYPFLIMENNCQMIKTIMKFDPPTAKIKDEKKLKWSELFELCNDYREEEDIPKKDFVVLLTDRLNEWNWFSHVDDDRNIFIHTKNWNIYTDAHHKNPVAYQVAENILQYLMGINSENIENNSLIHLKPIGCVNDFCREKEEVMIKMRTGDICRNCSEKIIRQKIDARIVTQILSIFQGIRQELLFQKINQPFNPVEITLSSNKKLFLSAYDIEIPLNPLFKTLYLFFLTRPQGVRFSELFEHTEQLVQIYKKIRPGSSVEDARLRIKKLVNPAENNFSVAKSHINRIITKLLGEQLAAFYRFEGARGTPLKINLPNELINISL